MASPRVPIITRPKPAPSKIGPVSLDRTKAQTSNPPSENPSAGQNNRALVDTYFTKPTATGEGIDTIYTADRLWAKVTLTLETAGPVAVGTMSNIVPVLSGKGQLLQPGVPHEFLIAKGSKLYVASTSVNRISRTIEALPWLEQIAATITAIGQGIMALLNK
jgi:hypothetical protein